MSSKYQPQQFGWISDLGKGSNYLSSPDERLLYANEQYCAFIRKTLFNQILYLSISAICTILFLFLFFFFPSVFLYLSFYDDTGEFIFCVFVLLVIILAIYILLPEFYQNLLPAKGSPIIFNRKTAKVYINESYFFNFKLWRNPLMFFLPTKRRINEYDWADLQGVVIHNYSRNALNTTILMVCKPGTNQTIDHILLDPARSGVGKTFVWGWINNFMTYHRLANLNDGIYLPNQEEQFKQAHINGQHWPQWMLEAFNAQSLEQLAQIKQKYDVK